MMNDQITSDTILLKYSEEMLLLIDPATLEIRAVNHRCCSKLGYSRDRLVGMPITEIECALSDVFYWEDVRNGAMTETRDVESLYLRSDGTLLPVTKSITLDQSGDQRWLVICARDGNRQKLMEKQLEEITSQLRSTLEATADGILVVGRDGNIVNMNQRFARLWRLPPEILSRSDDRSILDYMISHVSDPAGYEARLDDILSLAEEETFDDLTLTDGTALEQKTRPHQTAKEIVGRVFTFTNITDRKLAEERIQQLAFYDLLTQLPNRRLLLDRLRQALVASARKEKYGALLFIDLDHFKTLNDTLGHDIGDLLLQHVAERLVKCVREGDTVARWGGDEFAIVLSDLGETAQDAAFRTETVGEKILTALNHPYLLSGHEYTSSPSIGIALFDDHQLSAEELMKRADIAMYQAKKAGRNTIRFFDPQMQAQIEARSAIEKWMQKALPEHQFRLYYQMQIDHAGRIHGAEVLLRWEHPDRGIIPPSEFIPLAEETGLIVPIGAWVLETACKKIGEWSSQPSRQHLQLAVNVSARQFYQPDFAHQINRLLHETGIDPGKLKLELTESLVLMDIEDTISKMTALKKIGIRFSMDDFGTGHSSLSSLKKLPLDQLKIDRSFVRDITTDPDDAIIVQTIIAMAKNLGMDVIAEGVESIEQRDFLAKHGCLIYQGYLFGHPVPIESFEQLIPSSAS